jgi:hypothetical protein
MKKIVLVGLIFLLGNIAFMNAQVTFGSDSEPTPGAVLDLQSGGTKGLLMPQVTLTSVYVWAPVAGSAVDGMTVFNLSDATTNGLEGTGVYVWINSSWRFQYHYRPCEGAIIHNGAYSGPGAGVYTADLDGSFQAGWTNAVFSALNRDLCWNKQDASTYTMLWTSAVSSCTGDWRLPNLKELQVLYEALGGMGGSAVNFGNLQSPHSNPGPAINMSSNSYWSSTEEDNNALATVYMFRFNDGRRSYGIKVGFNYARCVRTL